MARNRAARIGARGHRARVHDKVTLRRELIPARCTRISVPAARRSRTRECPPALRACPLGGASAAAARTEAEGPSSPASPGPAAQQPQSRSARRACALRGSARARGPTLGRFRRRGRRHTQLQQGRSPHRCGAGPRARRRCPRTRTARPSREGRTGVSHRGRQAGPQRLPVPVGSRLPRDSQTGERAHLHHAGAVDCAAAGPLPPGDVQAAGDARRGLRCPALLLAGPAHRQQRHQARAGERAAHAGAEALLE